MICTDGEEPAGNRRTDDMRHVLQRVLERAGHECRAYSGRGMYGRHCLGIDIDRGQLGVVFADVLENGALEEEEDIEAMAEAFRRMSTDSMGLGSVLYFPGIPYEEA